MEFIVNSPYRMLFFYFCCVWHNSTTMGRRRIEEMPETVTDNRSKSFLIYNFRFGDLRAAQLPEYGRSSLRGTWRSTSYLAALFYSHSSFNSFVSRYSEGKFKVFFWCDEIGSWTHDAWLKCLTTSAHVRCRRSFFGFCFPFSSVSHPSQSHLSMSRPSVCEWGGISAGWKSTGVRECVCSKRVRKEGSE